MANIHLHSVLLVFLSYSVAISVSQSNIDLVHQVCNHTIYSVICLSTLGADPASKTADLATLAILSIKLSHDHAKDTYMHVDKMQNSTQDPVLQQCCGDCIEEYADVMDQLSDSIDASGSKQYSNVNTWVRAAMADIQTCEDGLKDKKITSPLEHRNAVLSKMCSNALAINKLLGRTYQKYFHLNGSCGGLIFVLKVVHNVPCN